MTRQKVETEGEKASRAEDREVVIQGRPQLEEGVNLVKKPGKLPVFQSLIAEELEGRNATAVWIDTKNESSTYALSSYGSTEVMEKVRIGRAFTPFQHHQLIQQLEEFIQEDTEILVLPNISFLYIDGQVKEWEVEELFEEAWNNVLELQEEYGLKILVSLPPTDSSLNYKVVGDTDNEIEVEPLEQGWKYDSEDFDQLVYREGKMLQTTMPFWHRKRREKIRLEV